MPEIADPYFLDALAKAYSARAKLFHSGVRASNIDLLFAEIDAIDPAGLAWDDAIGISATALAKVAASGATPHQVVRASGNYQQASTPDRLLPQPGCYFKERNGPNPVRHAARMKLSEESNWMLPARLICREH